MEPKFPLTPSARNLPFGSLPWTDFQLISIALIKTHKEVQSCTGYGVGGDSQFGIDAEIITSTGRIWAAQFKREKNFGPAAIEAAVKEATYQAEHFIMTLSRPATQGARSEIAKYQNWELWDSDDLESKLQQLEDNEAFKIVRAYFGTHYARTFLGLSSSITPFVLPEEFFRRFSDPTHLFNHTLPLIGRTDTIQELQQFVDNSSLKVCIFPGRGGIGKSKILQEFSGKIQSSIAVRFLLVGMDSTSAHLEDLPVRPVLVVVDDAHRRNDLSGLIAYASITDGFKLLLAARPYSINILRSQIQQCGINSEAVCELADLPDLDTSQFLDLCDLALEPPFKHLKQRLAAVSTQTPLIAIVGGKLISEKKISPALLSNDAQFHQEVFNKFEDVLVGNISTSLDKDLCKNLLPVIAAISPIRTRDEIFFDTVGTFLKHEKHEIQNALATFSESGILIEQNSELRIIPDLLSDHILYKACFVGKGIPTNYPNTLFDHFWDSYPTQLLNNLAYVDWRNSHQLEGISSALLNSIWYKIRTQFSQSNLEQQRVLLKNIVRVAYLQPSEMLNLVEILITGIDIETIVKEQKFRLMETIAQVLQGVSSKYLSKSCELLWRMGRDDERDLDQTPSHAIRVLQDIVMFSNGKDPAWTEKAIDIVLPWFTHQSDIHDHVCSLIQVVEVCLQSTVKGTQTDGVSIIVSKFTIPAKVAKPVREKVLAALLCCSKGRLDVCIKVLNALQKALRQVTVLGTDAAAEKEKAEWNDERSKVIDCLEQILRSRNESCVRVRIADMLALYAKRDINQAIKDRCFDICGAITKDLDFTITLMLMNTHNWDWADFTSFSVPRINQYEFKKSLALKAVDDFVTAYPDANHGLAYLESKVDELISAELKLDCYQFFGALSKQQPAYGLALAQSLAVRKHPTLSRTLGALLFPLLAFVPNSVWQLADEITKSSDLDLLHGVCGLLYSIQIDEVHAPYLTRLLKSDNSDVVWNAIMCFRNIAPRAKAQMFALLLSANIENDYQAVALAEIVEEEFHDYLPSRSQYVALVKGLCASEKIDNDLVQQCLMRSYSKVPVVLVSTLMERIRKENSDWNFRALPLENGIITKKLRNKNAYKRLLHDVFSEIKKDHQRVSGFATLFSWISLNFEMESLEILQDFIRDETDMLAAANVLSRAPSEKIFDPFVFEFLETCKSLPADHKRQVWWHLANAARTPKEDPYEWTSKVQTSLDVNEKARKTLQTVAEASEAYQFLHWLISIPT